MSLSMPAALAVLWTLAMAGPATAGSRVVDYTSPPAWVKPPPTPTTSPTPDGAPLRVVYIDGQSRLTDRGQEGYVAYRLKVLRPEALTAGNLSVSWNPTTDEVAVNRLLLIRDGKVTDVLAKEKFRVIEREGNLENAVLDGNLTATLQVPGLEVGDEFEFALTLRRREPVFAGRWSVVTVLPTTGNLGVYRMLVEWPKSAAVRWQASPDLGPLSPVAEGDAQVLTVELRDPKTAPTADGAPSRFNVRRRLDVSQFPSWGEVAHALSPLFDQAAALGPQSPIRAEAAKIAATTADPKARALAALRLVQDRIRYVFVGLDGGAYRPATAEDTWTRRYGDCKAKTVLLLALLKTLGVPAQAVLVDSTGGDGMDARLPTPTVFDHVLVQVTIDGARYWLDGTRSGDSRLADLPAPVSRWGLPLSSGATDLVAIPPEAPTLPRVSEVLDVDATAGLDRPAKIKEEYVLRGDGVQAIRTQLSGSLPEDAVKATKAFLQGQDSWLDLASAAWRYDEAAGALVLTASGEGRLDVSGDDKGGHTLNIPQGGMSPPAEFKRPKDQDQTAPWLVDFPTFKRFTTVLHLPKAGTGLKWTYSADDMDVRMGGVAYWRRAGLTADTVWTTISRRSLKPEITAAEAKDVNNRLPKFDNTYAQVYETAATADSRPEGGKTATATGSAEALRAVDARLLREPKSIPTLEAKYNILQRRRDFAAALPVLDAIVAADPSQDVSLERAATLYHLGRQDEARKLYETFASSPRANANMNLQAASGASALGDGEGARAIVAAGLKAAPDSMALLRLQTALFMTDGRLDAALADADAVIRIKPEAGDGFVDRASVLNRLGRYDEALAAADEGLRAAPLSAFALRVRFEQLKALGRKDEASDAYDQWVANEHTGATLNERCWTLALANSDLDEAEADCALAVKLGPNSAAFWDSYAYVAFQAGRLDEARKRYDRALVLDPKLPTSIYVRGLLKTRTGDAAGGAQDIAAAKALNTKVESLLRPAAPGP